MANYKAFGRIGLHIITRKYANITICKKSKKYSIIVIPLCEICFLYVITLQRKQNKKIV